MSDRTDKIKQALSKLDPKDPADWTEAGLPKLDRMQNLTGFENLKRSEVGEAAPGYTRETASSAPSDLSNVGASDTANNAAPSNPAGETVSQEPEAEKSELDKAKELTSPNFAAEDNPNVGRTDLGPYEGQAHTSDQEERLQAELTADDFDTSPEAIAKQYKDPVLLLEAAVVAMNADDRYRKNGELQNFMRGYSISQVNIKANQERLNKRYEERKASQAAADEREKAAS